MPDFLLEIGCEEIPARMIDGASQELRERVDALLQRERLDAAREFTTLDSPRRLAVLAAGIPAAQADVTEQVTGPSAQVAYKDGQPTPAAHAFAKKVGVDVGRLEKVSTPKGEYLAATVTRKGRTAAEILAEALPEGNRRPSTGPRTCTGASAEKSLCVRCAGWSPCSTSKSSRWNSSGLPAGKTSRGHRIIGAETVAISRPSAYIETLRGAKVLGAAEREQVIRKALDAATRTIPGARWREDEPLLATVVNLTEFPSAILGSFDPEFLALPEEVLVTVMRDHQKYFAIEDASGKLLPHFLAVLNTAADSRGPDPPRQRTRAARPLQRCSFLLADRPEADSARARRAAEKCHVSKRPGQLLRQDASACSAWQVGSAKTIKQSGMAVRPGVVHKAALLAKADLTTELVKEFTELQGIVGGLYARVQDLDDDLKPEVQAEVAKAIYDHYKPESMEDSVPRTIEGAVLSIADKADSIAGMFALGLVPSGSKDPFALRRQANGIVKTIAEHKLPFRLSELMNDARDPLQRFRGGEEVF